MEPNNKSLQIPKQPNFEVDSEITGIYKLEDETEIEIRIILVDLSIFSEDILGIQHAVQVTTVIRYKVTDKIKQEIQSKPLVFPGKNIPLTEEAGFKSIKIVETLKEAQSSYKFDNHKIILSLIIDGIVKNDNYKTPSGIPIYNLRWRINTNIK